MNERLSFDLQAAHRFFSVDCFHRAWDLIDLPRRTPAEEDAMVNLSIASLWHWTQRDDCSPSNLGVGYWQISRVYVLLGQVQNAQRYARLCLDVCEKNKLGAFFHGYAKEALARSAVASGDLNSARIFLEAASHYAASIDDEEDRNTLLGDLDSIRSTLEISS